jgi:hypothetical protein
MLQGFVIPVNIRVTDANDNAPQFINAPYVLNISEVSHVTDVTYYNAVQDFINRRASALPGGLIAVDFQL